MNDFASAPPQRVLSNPFSAGRSMSGLDDLGSGGYTFKMDRRNGMVNVYGSSGEKLGTVSANRARAMRHAQDPSRSYREKENRLRAESNDYQQFRQRAREGSLPEGVKNMRDAAAHSRRQAHADANRARRDAQRKQAADRKAKHDAARQKKADRAEQNKQAQETLDKMRAERAARPKMPKNFAQKQRQFKRAVEWNARNVRQATQGQRTGAGGKTYYKVAGGMGCLPCFGLG